MSNIIFRLGLVAIIFIVVALLMEVNIYLAIILGFSLFPLSIAWLFGALTGVERRKEKSHERV